MHSKGPVSLLPLSIATTDYDHFRDIRMGMVKPEGIDPDVVRLLPDFLDMEEAYFDRTKVWPIMHIIAMQKRIVDANPWVPRNLFNAFQESKRRSIERLLDPAVSRYPLPWLTSYARKMCDRFGGDPFPYGIEENRTAWEPMALCTHQQGIARRQFTPEEIFPAGIMTSVVI